MPKDKKKDDDLDSMREEFRRHKEGRKRGSGENAWDKLSEGANLRRILPIPGSKKFYTDGWTHFNMGPNDRALRCIDEDSVDVERGLPKSTTKCPSCKKFLREQSRINSEYKKGDKDGHEEWRRAKDKYAPRRQYYSNDMIVDDDGSVEIKILAYGPQVWGQFMNYFLGDDTNVGDFTHPESGRMMNIKKEKKSKAKRNVEYHVYAKDELDISDSWDEIKENLHDLDAAVGKILSKDEFIAVMKGIDPDKDKKEEEDDEDDDDDDDSSDDSSSGRRDEDDDEDEEEEEDEDDRPVKKKSSKLSKKRRDD